MQRNQERQLVKLLVADGNAIDIHTCDEGIHVGTLRNPVVSGQGVSVLKALIVAASRKKQYVRKNVGFMDTNEEVIQYEYDYEPLGEVGKPTIEGMSALLTKRRPFQVYSRNGKMHILIQSGIQIQGHGATLFKALADTVQKLKNLCQASYHRYSDTLDDIEMYEQHYGEIA